MNVVYQILFDAGRLLAYFLIILSFFISGCVLFKPGAIIRLNVWLNQVFCTKKIGKKMDSTVDTSAAIIKYRWLIGGVFLIGSLFTVKYALMDFNPKKFVDFVIRPKGSAAAQGYLITSISIQWLFVISSSMGAIACLCLMFLPDLFNRISSKLDTTVSTEKVGIFLDSNNNILDKWVLKHHVLVGSFLFLASSYLVVVFLFVFR